MQDTKSILMNKIVCFKAIYKFAVDYFSIFIFFFQNQKFNFPDEIYEIWKNLRKQYCLFEINLQLWYYN